MKDASICNCMTKNCLKLKFRFYKLKYLVMYLMKLIVNRLPATDLSIIFHFPFCSLTFPITILGENSIAYYYFTRQKPPSIQPNPIYSFRYLSNTFICTTIPNWIGAGCTLLNRWVVRKMGNITYGKRVNYYIWGFMSFYMRYGITLCLCTRLQVFSSTHFPIVIEGRKKIHLSVIWKNQKYPPFILIVFSSTWQAKLKVEAVS
jgi:hypothetical protein